MECLHAVDPGGRQSSARRVATCLGWDLGAQSKSCYFLIEIDGRPIFFEVHTAPARYVADHPDLALVISR